MNKNLFWLIALLFTLSFGFMSCAEDTTVEDPYANWEDRNVRYLDSIADVHVQMWMGNGKYTGIINLQMKVRLLGCGKSLPV